MSFCVFKISTSELMSCLPMAGEWFCAVSVHAAQGCRPLPLDDGPIPLLSLWISARALFLSPRPFIPASNPPAPTLCCCACPLTPPRPCFVLCLTSLPSLPSSPPPLERSSSHQGLATPEVDALPPHPTLLLPPL